MFRKIFDHYGIEQPKLVFNEKTNSQLTASGCSQGHIKMLRMAKFKRWDYVVIFEDDACPCLDWKEVFNNALNEIPLDTWECLKLETTNVFRGMYPNGCHDITNYWYKKYWCPGFPSCGSAAYVVSKRGIDKFLTEYAVNSRAIADIVINSVSNENFYYIKSPIFLQQDLHGSEKLQYTGNNCVSYKGLWGENVWDEDFSWLKN